MSNVNEKWAGYILRLDRETHEYKYGSWYDHYWNEVYDVFEGADQTSRGERIRIDALTEDGITFTFFDEEARWGVEGAISLEDPRVCLRGVRNSGGSNENAWSHSDYVILTIEKKEGQ